MQPKSPMSRYVVVALALLSVALYACDSARGSVYDIVVYNAYPTCTPPLVLLGNGANGTSLIYEGNTSAKITIDATASETTYNFSLNIFNNDSSLYEVKLEYFDFENINKTDTTIVLHDNSTSQQELTISGGTINQTESYYSLAASATIHLGVMNLVENWPEQTTILRVFLRMTESSSTVFTLYMITFEFT